MIEDHEAETEPLQLEGNRRKLSLVHKFRDELFIRKIPCEKLFDPNISVDDKLKELLDIQQKNYYFHYVYRDYFEAYRQYIQKTYRYIQKTISVEDVTNHLSDLIERCNMVHKSVKNLNQEEFVSKEILEDVWNTFNGFRDFKDKWGYLDSLNFDDNQESPLKKIRDMINNRREGIENCSSILENDLNYIRDIDKRHYKKLQLVELAKFDAINLGVGGKVIYSDVTKAHSIIQNIMGIYDSVIKKYKACFRGDSKFGHLYTNWYKYANRLTERLQNVRNIENFMYRMEINEFNRGYRDEILDNYQNQSRMRLLKSIQYVENRLEKIKFIIEKYSLNINSENEKKFWRDKTVRYLKIRDDLLEQEWEDYIKQKDNYINYEGLFDGCVERRIGLVELGMVRNAIVYSINRIKILFPNILSSNKEEGEFWRSQEKRHFGK